MLLAARLPCAQSAAGNTTISFFNVGACGVVSAVLFEFKNTDNLCAPNFRSGQFCRVPGPYGRQVYVTLYREVAHLDITLLDPSNDDTNLTSAIRVFLAPKQDRNHIGAYVRPGTLATGCGLGFTVGNLDDAVGEIKPRYFRSMFRHAALGIGSMRVVSNGDSTIGTLGEGEALTIDQLLVSATDMPSAVSISFEAETGGISATSNVPEVVRLWGSTCERCECKYVSNRRRTALRLPSRIALLHTLCACFPRGVRSFARLSATHPFSLSLLLARYSFTVDLTRIPCPSLACSTSTAFVVYGRPPALPLQVLRLDGAGLKTCSYTAAQTMKFTAEVAFYNTVATPNRYLFAFGLSPFLPYGTVSRSLPLEWTGSWAGNATQPGELWVKVVDTTTGAVRVLSQRVPLNAQSRNVIGISLADDGTSIRLDTLQAENDTYTAPPVASGHFRLIFAHAALTLPPATIYANDDLELVGVPAGGQGILDHPLLPPHQAGRILKFSFVMAGQRAVSALIDLSTLCDGAAYALVVVGTANRLDAYDPVLMQVDGTPIACSLSSASVASGKSASLALLSMAPMAGTTARFEFGTTLLSLDRRTVPLAFGDATVTDVPIGDFFMRLLQPDPPFAPLTPVMAVSVAAQSRNVVIARTRADRSGELAWQLVDLGAGASTIAAGSTRVLLLNTLEGADGGGFVVSATVRGSAERTLTLMSGGSATIDYPSDGGMSISFAAAGAFVGLEVQLPFGEACPQSVQLVAVGGIVGSSASTKHVDAADGYCRLVVPNIPDREALQGITTQPPTTTSTLDIFGPGGPGDGGLIQDSSAACAGHRLGVRSQWWLLLFVTAGAASAPLLRSSTRRRLPRY